MFEVIEMHLDVQVYGDNTWTPQKGTVILKVTELLKREFWKQKGRGRAQSQQEIGYRWELRSWQQPAAPG
jgi:hypothetical protein